MFARAFLILLFFVHSCVASHQALSPHQTIHMFSGVMGASLGIVPGPTIPRELMTTGECFFLSLGAQSWDEYNSWHRQSGSDPDDFWRFYARTKQLLSDVFCDNESMFIRTFDQGVFLTKRSQGGESLPFSVLRNHSIASIAYVFKSCKIQNILLPELRIDLRTRFFSRNDVTILDFLDLLIDAADILDQSAPLSDDEFCLLAIRYRALREKLTIVFSRWGQLSADDIYQSVLQAEAFSEAFFYRPPSQPQDLRPRTPPEPIQNDLSSKDDALSE